MNSLEFINKEIDTYKQLKEQTILRIPDEDDEIQLHLLQRRINTINERLPILEQIKSELEAWKVVKIKTLITDGGVIHMAIEDDDVGYETVIKALEVENE